ncbi:MAG: hypothetical protein ACFFDQ_13285 [Candidatus Thorarchaeota archaeon]
MPTEDIQSEPELEKDKMMGYVKSIPGAVQKAQVVTDKLGEEERRRKKIQQGIQILIWVLFLSVVIIELTLAVNLSIGVARLDIEQLIVMSAQMTQLAIIDKLLIVALLGTVVFEKRE